MKCVVSRSPYATSSIAAAGTTLLWRIRSKSAHTCSEPESEPASVSVLAAPLQIVRSRQKWATPSVGYPNVAFPASGEPFLLWQPGDRKQQADIGQARQRRCPGACDREPGLVEAGLECS
jgi:hypothetical protein